MTLSVRHEEIVDDVREAWLHWKLKPENESALNIWMAIEHCVAKVVVPGLSQYVRADAYIGIGDKCGPIMLEVNHMPLEKWDSFYCDDGLPVRVLRVSMMRQAHLMHPRTTKNEIGFIDFVRKHLTDLQEREK